MMWSIAGLLAVLYDGIAGPERLWGTVAVAVIALAVRFVCTVGISRMGWLSSKTVKHALREQIYRKLLRLGASYKERAGTAEIVQVAVEGVDRWRPISAPICPSSSTPCWPR